MNFKKNKYWLKTIVYVLCSVFNNIKRKYWKIELKVSVVVFFSLKLPSSKFKNLIYLKAFRALAEPGEAVGLLAAQVMGCRFFPFTCLT